MAAAGQGRAVDRGIEDEHPSIREARRSSCERQDIRKTLADTTPLYAFVGAGDLAVAKIREVPARIAELRSEKLAHRKPVRERVADSAAEVRDRLGEKFDAVAKDARETYRGPAARGHEVVDRVRGRADEAGQDTKEFGDEVAQDANWRRPRGRRLQPGAGVTRGGSGTCAVR